MKTKIYEFDPVVYPVRLWVCKKPSAEDVDKLFYPLDNDGEAVDSFGDAFDRRGQRATTLIVKKKTDGWYGCLIALTQPGECGAGVCAHEALHFAAYLGEELNIPLGSFDTSEALAYLEQWATNCIWSVLVGHPERMNGKLLKEKEI